MDTDWWTQGSMVRSGDPTLGPLATLVFVIRVLTSKKVLLYLHFLVECHTAVTQPQKVVVGAQIRQVDVFGHRHQHSIFKVVSRCVWGSSDAPHTWFTVYWFIEKKEMSSAGAPLVATHQ